MSFETWNASHGSLDLDQRNREFSIWQACRVEADAEIAALRSERDALHDPIIRCIARWKVNEVIIAPAILLEQELKNLLSTQASGEPARKP